MAEALQGKQVILMVRRLDEAKSKAAMKPLFQIEHSVSYERSLDATQTKDGAVNSDGGLEVTLSLQGLASKDATNEYMLQAVKDGAVMEFWSIDLTEEGKTENAGKYKAEYMRGKVASWEVPYNVEDLVEISTEANIDGIPQSGFATVAKEVIEQAQYAFTDTVKAGE
ncbi:phage major tail protein, TP901-1 family [Enterococcus faecium]|nr:phage major tail protein, TP901-1 family [Enterococcus faecium]